VAVHLADARAELEGPFAVPSNLVPCPEARLAQLP